MQTRIFMAIAALAIGVYSTPIAQEASSISDRSPHHHRHHVKKVKGGCGEGSVQACCNTGDSTGLIPVNPSLCSIPVLDILGNPCTGGSSPACCQGSNSGGINLEAQCIPLAA